LALRDVDRLGDRDEAPVRAKAALEISLHTYAAEKDKQLTSLKDACPDPGSVAHRGPALDVEGKR